jgi:hypothetical protein
MAIDYRRMRATATRLLTENGKAYQLTRGGTITRDQYGKVVTEPVTRPLPALSPNTQLAKSTAL